mgnify:CR=1 FL=1
MSMNQYETIVFFNKNVGTHNRRDCDRYMDYLHKIGKYSNALNDMISEQVAKENVELSSDIQIRSDLKADEYEKINLEDRFLYLMSDRKTNFTNLFHLDNNYIPNDNEIDLMRDISQITDKIVLKFSELLKEVEVINTFCIPTGINWLKTQNIPVVIDEY